MGLRKPDPPPSPFSSRTAWAKVRLAINHQGPTMRTLPAGYPQEAFEAFAWLTNRKQLTVEDMQVLAMIECYGEAYYFVLADGVDNPEAKALLRRNGQEERGHAHRLLKAIKLKSGSDYTLPSSEENPFFKSLPKSLVCDAGIIAAFEQGEANGDLVYQAWADGEPDATVAELLRQNGREETRHGERVTEVRRLLNVA
jgi:Rubrerythrin